MSMDASLGPASAPRPLRVLTMNIWNFAEPYAARMQRLRVGIERLAPDLMAFQEAGFAPGRHQVGQVLDGLGYHVAHQFEVAPWPGADNGCCLATRWPLTELEVVLLDVTPRAAGYPYALLLARVAVPAPVGSLLLVCAKPSWELHREHERELQALRLAQTVAERARPDDFPVVIGGDFDATPVSGSIRFLCGQQSLAGHSVHFRDAWSEAGDDTPGYTWEAGNGYARAIIDAAFHARRHARRIDYIFLGSPHDYRPWAAFRTCRVELAAPEAGVWASDHYAVYAEIDVSR
jgi:endonuclease/exonuclease/phosphatase family metal-dependent hydrolase